MKRQKEDEINRETERKDGVIEREGRERKGKDLEKTREK